VYRNGSLLIFFFSLYEIKNECVQNNPEGVREVIAEENMST
jgi:hypothetical protein